MSSESTTHPFFLVANQIALDLVNTTPVVAGSAAEWLDSIAAYGDWLRVVGVVPAEWPRVFVARHAKRPSGELLLAEVRQLRGAIRELAHAVIAGRSPAVADLDLLNRSANGPRPRELLHFVASRPGVTCEPPPLDGSTLGPTLAREAVRLFTQYDLDLIRTCSNPECVLMFLDTTKNRARRWCSMSACGNRHKVSQFHKRRQSEARRDRAAND